MTLVPVVYWIYLARWDGTNLANPAANQPWFLRSSLYAKFGITLLIVAVASRLAYWLIEFKSDRQRLILGEEELDGRSTR